MHLPWRRPNQYSLYFAIVTRGIFGHREECALLVGRKRISVDVSSLSVASVLTFVKIADNISSSGYLVFVGVVGRQT